MEENIINLEIVNDYGDVKSFRVPYSLQRLLKNENYKITLHSGYRRVCSYACGEIILDKRVTGDMNLDIDLDGTNLEIDSYGFCFYDVKINSLTVHNKTNRVSENAFRSLRPINNITIPCDFDLFSRLYLSGDNRSLNLFAGSNFTLTYNNEKELIKFVNDINRFFSLIYSKLEKNEKSYNKYGSIDFIYKHNLYKFDDARNCKPVKEYLDSKRILSTLYVKSFTLKGPVISDELITSLFPSFPIKKEFTVVREKSYENTNVNDNNLFSDKLTSEAKKILSLAKEVTSIDFIGINKNEVKQKVDAIVSTYNNGLSSSYDTLSLNTNNTLYTNAIISLENLKSSLNQIYEKNGNYYDIMNLIQNMIKTLRGEKVSSNYEIISDLEKLVDILKYSNDEETKKEIIVYLMSERQNVIDYLYGKKTLDYNDANSFIKTFRKYLMPILIKVSSNLSKIDVISTINNKTLEQMDKTQENIYTKYINNLLKEIDKIKKEILLLDPSYTFNGIDYSLFSSGKEITTYLENLFKKYYRVYLDLLYEKEKMEAIENSKVPMIY